VAEVLRREISLRCSAAHAFRIFTEHVDLWWPRGHRRNAEGELRFEPGVSGRIVDRGPDGNEWTMAEVVAFEPPSRLALDWYPGSPVAPTHVEVTFADTGSGTTVTVVHQPLSAGAEEIWPQRIAIFTKGWEAVLPALKAYAEQNEGD
jgi:uncharacterized protein YndB with AHSA1/START domain